MKGRIFLFFAMSITALLNAQKSDLYLLDLVKIADSYELVNCRYLSGFNPDGYTNQPSFVDLYTLLVAAGTADNPQETDLYFLDVRSNRITRITKTQDREYSPVITRKDEDQLACVVVDVENNDRQLIWQYPLDRSDGGKLFAKSEGQIGYFKELPGEWLALFEVGSPNKLYLQHQIENNRKFINSNIGRCLRSLRDGSLVYVHKFSDDYWFLKKVSASDFRSEIIKKTLPQSEDFEVLDDDSIIMAKESKIFILSNGENRTWAEIADLKSLGIENVTRIAFNGINQLAIVDQK